MHRSTFRLLRVRAMRGGLGLLIAMVMLATAWPVSPPATPYEALAQDTDAAELNRPENGSTTTDTMPSFTWSRAADAVSYTFEDAANVSMEYELPAWVHDFPADRFIQLIYGVSVDQIDEVLAKTRASNTGFVWITDDHVNTGSPYNTLPTYWSSLNEQCRTAAIDRGHYSGYRNLVGAYGGTPCPDGIPFSIDMGRPNFRPNHAGLHSEQCVPPYAPTTNGRNRVVARWRPSF
jgi:hypothetical protein